MAAFRILNQFPVYFDSQGRLADGGSLRFYESGTSTPKDVYGTPDLSVNNGSTVTVGSDGRTIVDVWGDGSYRVRLYDADDTLIGEADDVEVAGGTGSSIPALVTGQFLTNNGALLLWAPVLQMPDPTGQDGKYPVANGTGYTLQSPPDAPVVPDPEIVVGDASFQAGISTDTTKYYVQVGTGSAPASGSRSTNASVSFPETFGVLWHVSLTQTHSGVTALAAVPAQSVTTKSTTGFSVLFNIHDQSTNSQWDITSPVPFTWMAIGTKTVSEDPPVTPA